MKKTLINLLVIFTIGCNSDDNNEVTPSPILTQMTIDASIGDLLVVNQTQQLNLLGTDQFNNPIAIASNIVWTSSNTNVTIDENGLAKGIEKGTSLITAETQNLTASFDISVEVQKLSKLVITSPNNKIDLNETINLTVGQFDQIGNNMIINENVNWSASNSYVALEQNGLVTGIAVGSTIITAEANGISSTLSLTVWDSSAPRTEIYVSDVGVDRNGPHIIFKYDEDGTNGTKFISTNLSNPQDIIFLEDQQIVLISNLKSNNINKYDINTGEYIGLFANGINGPTRMEIGPDNLIYVLQWNGGPVKRYQKNGDFVDDFTNASINEAIGIAWDSENNLYVSSFNQGSNGFVKKFDVSGNDLGLFINANLNGPTDIWFDNEGNMLVNDWSGNKVKKFDSSGNFTSNFITGLNQPEGVDFLNSNILIGNSGDGSVKMYDTNGILITNLVAAGSAGLNTTNAVTIRYINQ